MTPNRPKKRGKKPVFIRWAFLSEYGISGFVFQSKGIAESELRSIKYYNNLEVVKVEMRVIE